MNSLHMQMANGFHSVCQLSTVLWRAVNSLPSKLICKDFGVLSDVRRGQVSRGSQSHAMWSAVASIFLDLVTLYPLLSINYSLPLIYS